jgi:hypothetical protein
MTGLIGQPDFGHYYAAGKQTQKQIEYDDDHLSFER